MTVRRRATWAAGAGVLAVSVVVGALITLRHTDSAQLSSLERAGLNPPGRPARYVDVHCFSIPGGYSVSPNVSRPIDYACSYLDMATGTSYLTGIWVVGGRIAGGTGATQLPDRNCVAARSCLFDRLDVIEPTG